MTRALTAVIALTTLAACATGDETTNVRTTAAPHPLPRVAHGDGPARPVVSDWAIAVVRWDVTKAETERASRDARRTTTTTAARLIPPQNIERASGTPTTRQLDALADCESGDHDAKEPFTHNVDAHNGPYHSAFQWSMKSWNSHVKGMGRHDLVGVDPHTLDYPTQREITRGVPLSAWPRQFPACTRMLREVGEL